MLESVAEVLESGRNFTVHGTNRGVIALHCGGGVGIREP
jgi:hypothetical protein